MRNAAIERITCGELLDDLLEYARTNIKPSTEKIGRLIIEANIRPFFGHWRAIGLTTEILKDFMGVKSERSGRVQSLR